MLRLVRSSLASDGAPLGSERFRNVYKGVRRRLQETLGEILNWNRQIRGFVRAFCWKGVSREGSARCNDTLVREPIVYVLIMDDAMCVQAKSGSKQD